MPKPYGMSNWKEVLMSRKLAFAFAVGLSGLGATGASATEVGDEAVSADASTYSTAAAVSASTAQDGTPAGDDAWEFAVTPYLWMSGANIEVETPQGEDVVVDQSFGDVLGDLKFAFMGAFEARKGRFVTVQDIIYLSLGSSADANIGPIPLEAELDMKQLITTHLFGYRVVDEGPMSLDLMAGARFAMLKVDIELSGPLQTFRRDSKRSEIGPVIASRFRAPLGGPWAFSLYGDLGGFGLGADLSWQLLGTVQYEISDHWRLSAGWRHLHASQEKNDFKVDYTLDGPIIGVTYRF